jgi:hypothetical protein
MPSQPFDWAHADSGADEPFNDDIGALLPIRAMPPRYDAVNRACID